MFSQKRKFKNAKGLTLSAIYEGEDTNAPVVVLCHGYGSSKDSESTKNLSQKLVTSGFSVYRFDFSGCGASQGKLNETTPSGGANDLESAVRDLGKDKYALFGSSYGGYIALQYAAKNSVLALCLKAPVSDYMPLIRAANKEFKSGEFEKEAKDVNIYKMAKNIKAPTLIVHGGDDEVVPLEQSEKLLKSLGGEKELAIIHAGTHQMRGPAMEDAHSQLAEFFRNELL